MKTPEDEEFERIEAESGWRKRQIALNQKAENARELGLDYKPQRTWVGLTDEEIENAYIRTKDFVDMARVLEDILKEKNT
jgi:hypothetical protein